MGDASFNHIDLVGARIGGQLNLQGAHVSGHVRMEQLRVEEGVFFRDTRFDHDVNMMYAYIDDSLDLRGARTKTIDLTGSRVGWDLRNAVSDRLTHWSDGSRINLYNAHTGAIVDEPSPNIWPPKVGLDGFTYGRFGGFRVAKSLAERDSKSFVEWLARDEPYTPQPYHQCAKVLREMGHPDMADDVLYAGRERERKEALRSGNNPRATGLALLKWTVGYSYGHRYFRSLWWVLAFVALGTAVLHLAGIPTELTGSWDKPAFFSLDLLLPIIQLHEPHYKIVLDGAARYYFAVHKLMGYVLASFLIAGLAGLTK